MILRSWLGFLCLIVGMLSSPAIAQDGAVVFDIYCSACHDDGNNEQAPSRDVLGQLSPEQILQSLEGGAMARQADERSRAQRRALAEYLSGEALGNQPTTIPQSAYCVADGGAVAANNNEPSWNGWGGGITNPRFQDENAAGMSADDLPQLKLKWAFGLPGASTSGTQPVVHSGRVYFGDAEGDLFAIDAASGCIHWNIEVEAGIRSAVVLAERSDGTLAAYFGDQTGNMYAVDAASGAVLWKTEVDDHPQAAITAASVYHAGRLYVPVSSREESKVADPRYPCCEFRGSVLALDTETGEQVWKSILIEEPQMPGQTNSVGTVIMGPSGVPVWSTPTIDVERNRLYFGTGNNYSPPATRYSDAIIALDMDSGEILWHRQQTENDIWNSSCRRPDREAAVCPEADAPDVDFSVSPVLIDDANGRPMLVVGNKSSMIWALDPDGDGELLWEQQVGMGSSRGGVIWGIAVDGERVFVPNGFFNSDNPDASGGMAAVALDDGRHLWSTPNPPCGDRERCMPTHAAAVTAIEGAVFSGTMDGQLYAYSSTGGEILWHFDTAQGYDTVNGVPANGGSMSNGGAVIVDGMLFVQSGYSHHGGIIPGNVLLGFGLE
jgi:polyvinyl alcohol dehydrogenase (cytochrome)